MYTSCLNIYCDISTFCVPGMLMQTAEFYANSRISANSRIYEKYSSLTLTGNIETVNLEA